MEIYVTNVFVDDQDKALEFYVNILGFELKNDIPVGAYRWLTVTGKNSPDGTELLLEPSSHRAVPTYKKALYDDGIAAASFRVDDLDSEYERLCQAGVRFHTKPIAAGPVKMAMLDDGCGNLIQLIEMIDQSSSVTSSHH